MHKVSLWSWHYEQRPYYFQIFWLLNIISVSCYTMMKYLKKTSKFTLDFWISFFVFIEFFRHFVSPTLIFWLVTFNIPISRLSFARKSQCFAKCNVKPQTFIFHSLVSRGRFLLFLIGIFSNTGSINIKLQDPELSQCQV